ncbi:MAG: hypothetical protein GWP21_01380 [Euryarchaeota archaeon]|jgi:hypothetical protein|nr:hypothetical protein [Euryarchaeota archaeon]MBT7243833.1 hypothetical protein [Euryarchaeota archaeon]NCF96547.1 hypothetical protein [Euryarchaeota archaeon]
MGEEFATVLEWRGSQEIGLRLAALIPDGISSNLSQESIEQEGGASLYKLEINVEADSLQELRQIVDDLLALFSDQDQ